MTRQKAHRKRQEPQGAARTRAEVARVLGVRREALERWVARGCPAPPAGSPWSPQDVEAARAWRASNLGRSRRGRSSPAALAAGPPAAGPVLVSNPSARLLEAQARAAVARADSLELRYAKDRGLLVPVETYRGAVLRLCGEFRAALLALPSTLSAQLEGLDEPSRRRLIEDRIAEILRSVSINATDHGPTPRKKRRAAQEAPAGAGP